MSRRVEQVCVVGRDAAALIAAVSIQRALGRGGAQVRLIELPSMLQPTDCYAAVPSLRALHDLLGLEESLVLRAARGTPMVAQRYSNWSGAAPPFLHGIDTQPPAGGDLNFWQYWIKGRLEGLKVELEDFSLAAAAAKQGRVPIAPGGQPPPLAASFGYHLDALGYAHLLRQFAQASGVEGRRSRSIEAELDGERIAAVVLDDGERVEADLFIDASGAEGALIRAMPGAGFDSWSDYLPANRILSASAPRLSQLPAFSEVSAFRGGWTGLYPLQDRTAVVAAYNDAFMDDEEVVQSLSVLARLPMQGDAVVAPWEAGIQTQPWIGNCVAVGEAAVVLEPLDGVQLHMVHSCVSHLMTLFPTAAEDMPEARAYNRVIADTARNVRDFQFAHYRLNKRFDEPLWDRARDADVPDSLARKFDLFEARGVIPVYDHESFEDSSWAALFAGHGLQARGYDPRVDHLSDQDHIAKVQDRLRDIAMLVSAMPAVEDYLQRSAQRQPAMAGQ